MIHPPHAVTHIFDIDGTVVDFHTNTWIAGAKETLIGLYRQGDKIIFMTGRGEQDRDTVWSPDMTRTTILKELDEAGLKYDIIFGCPSPRVFHDDSPVYVDRRVSNQVYV